ncbi:DNA methyltransferase [Streptomyces fulvorobeus]|uniref:DNA methylase n=1 Tax=Streptomyces fulvorobeus TaxID=284028 RepID=A0A7J0C4V0_9ACTN|nr:DNA methyltransferase [Streptomyces fulvorobeus]NYE40844.1 adenine-specific DNA methylase [Streptomyces fulvorobeus]GFM97157.1 DNA methylase [Streptomyces fulvorobeus]
MTLFEIDRATDLARKLYRVPARTALEYDFPAAELSQIGEAESWRKEVHRPATSTHKWWAKRLGSVFRGILTSALTDDRSKALDAYSTATSLDGITVFDPFSGSGTTIVEAAKLGASVVGWDINPVATLTQRQAVQMWETSELQRAFKILEVSCRSEIDRVHRSETGETVLYYFWVGLADCLDCGVATRLFSSHVFSQHAYPKRVPDAQIVCPECLDILPGRYEFQEMECSNGHRFRQEGAVSRSVMTCPQGHTSKVVDALGGQPPKREMFAKLVLGFDGKKRYEPISNFDRDLYTECSELLKEKQGSLVAPRGGLDDGQNTRQATRWGFREWRQFFNDRQLYSLGLLGAAIRELDVNASEREALATLFSGTLEFNNMFCSFKGEGTGAVRHMFSNHVLKPERTPLEAHPWGTPASSGSFSTLFSSRIMRAQAYKVSPADQVLVSGQVKRVEGLSQPIELNLVDEWPAEGLPAGTVYLRTGDSSQTDLPDGSVDLVVTDPPYMDNVHYSELADFFHAWLREIGPFDHYPVGRETTRSVGEVQSASPDEFREAIARVWGECARVLKVDGLLAFTFHQARISGWVALMHALADAGLVVTAVRPVKGEMATSVTKGGKEPSNLDSVVVCRKRSGTALNMMTDPRAASRAAELLLSELLAAQVPVGAGDIRSVVRGYVLATYTANPEDIDLLATAALADDLATECIGRLVP